MPYFQLLRRAVIGVPMLLLSPTAHADAGDYEFRPQGAEVRTEPGTELSVLLVHKASGQPVIGAIVFRTRLDMSPDGMGTMTAETAAVGTIEPGLYRFRADLTMAGRWALKLMAKVQGEPETIEATIVFTAK